MFNIRKKYDALISKLFGTMGDLLTDTYSEDWKTRDVGFVGKLDGRTSALEKEVTALKEMIEIMKGGK